MYLRRRVCHSDSTYQICHFDGLVQDCSNSSALAMELLQSCAKPSIHGVLVIEKEGNIHCFWRIFEREIGMYKLICQSLSIKLRN